MSITASAATSPALQGSPAMALAAAQKGAATRATAAVLIATGCLSLAPVAVLGPAIGWPASLGLPAPEQLARIGQAPGAVAAGYGLYLVYSMLFLPALALAAQRLLGTFSRSWVQLVVAFAALSALARCIGILRWLTVMPQLSQAHAAADAQGRSTIETVFDAVNSYGGGIGELLGVSLFAALALGVLVVGAARARTTPRWLTGLGLVATAGLVGMFLPTVGVPLKVPAVAGVTLVSLWMWALGGWMLLTRSRVPG